VIPALRGAVVTIVAVLISFGVMYAICTGAGAGASPAILAAALAVGLARRPERLEPHTSLLKGIALPLVALAAGAVGLTFRAFPPLGAALFCAGISLSVWLRAFGERGNIVGRIIALPFLAMLIVPVRVETARGPGSTAVLVIIAGVVAFACSAAVQRLAGGASAMPAERARKSTVAGRMAAQMLVALALAFTVGMLAFPVHWPWVVLTAFIVCSGAAGRGDAVYKAILRVAGAIGGTLVAALLARVALPGGAASAALIFIVLFLGLWLRQLNYAYWAACATLIFALLQGSHGLPALPLFALRIACIVIGALCGIAATWFVYPIRTEHVVRRRVANALAAMQAVLRGGNVHDLAHHIAQLDRIAPSAPKHRALLRETRALLTYVTAGGDRKHAGAELRRLGALLKEVPTRK